MYCHKCGAELPDDAKFCSKCGALMKNVEASSETDKIIYGNIPDNKQTYKTSGIAGQSFLALT